MAEPKEPKIPVPPVPVNESRPEQFRKDSKDTTTVRQQPPKQQPPKQQPPAPKKK